MRVVHAILLAASATIGACGQEAAPKKAAREDCVPGPQPSAKEALVKRYCLAREYAANMRYNASQIPELLKSDVWGKISEETKREAARLKKIPEERANVCDAEAASALKALKKDHQFTEPPKCEGTKSGESFPNRK